MIFKGEKYLSVKETILKLSVSSATLYRMLAEGIFTDTGDTFVMRRKRFFSEKSIDKYIDSQIRACM